MLKKYPEGTDPNDMKYKGRVVFRGDQVKDHTGKFAVFIDQSTTASQMMGIKFLDVVARMPGCDGEDSDAVAAYTQVNLNEIDQLFGPEARNIQAETWLKTPKHQQPSWWSDIKDPVVPLKKNLYGLCDAGLTWYEWLKEGLV